MYFNALLLLPYKEYTDVVRRLKDKLLDLNEQKAQLDEENRELIKTKTKLELDIKDSEDAVKEFHSSKVSFTRGLFDFPRVFYGEYSMIFLNEI